MIAFALKAQTPRIYSVDKASAAPNEIVSIKGSGFGTTQANLAVYFGGVQGIINAVSDQLLEVKTPFGTSFDKITVFNKTSGLGPHRANLFFSITEALMGSVLQILNPKSIFLPTTDCMIIAFATLMATTNST